MPLGDGEDEELDHTVSEILDGMMSNDNKSSGYATPNGFIDQKAKSAKDQKCAAIQLVNESQIY